MRHDQVRPERGIIHPHPVKDHPDAPRQGDHGAFRTATASDLGCHVLSHVELPRCIMTVAAWQSARRRLTSPALVTRSPDWFREGVRPTHGPTFFEDVNLEGSSTADR